MVRGWRFQRVIPRHAPCLDAADYLTYLTSWFTSHRNRALSLEKIWEPLLGQRWIVPTPTGRHALWGFLNAAGLQEGDEVLVAAYNFSVIVRMVLQKKLVPVFVDIDPDTLCVDPEDLAKKITGRTRLVIVTHMFGSPADMQRIVRLCTQRRLLLFEDCAHAVGTSCGPDYVGQFGDGALFSFGVYKLVNTFGGGMLVVRDASRFRADLRTLNRSSGGLVSFADNFIRCVVSMLLSPTLHTVLLYPFMRFAERKAPRVYHLVYPSSHDPTYTFEVGGRAPFKPYMKRMIRRQLARLETHIARRRAIVQRVKSALQGIADVRLLHEDKHGRSNCSYFGICVPDPEALAKHLEADGIVSNPHEYDDCSSLLQFSAYQSPCPNANDAARHVLRLPNFPSLRDEEIERMVSSIRAYFANRSTLAEMRIAVALPEVTPR
jgi:dTDP-4-amino-4,6-dideoxygalactose transaminase